jgi:hypothetical protein
VDCKKICLLGIFLPILLIFASTAFAGPLPLTPLDPVPGPSFADGNQFGDLIIGPVSVYFQETEGAFAGWLRAWAWENDTNTTFVYRIEMDPTPPGASIDTFRLATALPPNLAIEEIVDVGYNNYYATADPNTAPALCWSGVDGFLTVIDFDYKNSPDDDIGLLAGTTSEVYIQTTNDVDVDDVFALFINAGTSVDITIGGVVVPGAPPQVPEPGTVVMILAGVAGMTGIVVRRRLR